MSEPRQIPRQPTNAEVLAIVQAFRAAGNSYLSEHTVQEGLALVEAAWVAVFDRYSSGGPGFVGKVAYVVFDGSPTIVNALLWNERAEDFEVYTGELDAARLLQRWPG